MLPTASAQRFLCQPRTRLSRLGGLESRVRILRRLLAKQCWVIIRNNLRSNPRDLSVGLRRTSRELTRGEGANECGATLESSSTSKSIQTDNANGLGAESSLAMVILSANSLCRRRITDSSGCCA